MIYSNILFEMLRNVNDRTKKKVNKKKQSFILQKLLMGQMDNLIKSPQIYATLYFMIHSIDICDMLTNLMGWNK